MTEDNPFSTEVLDDAAQLLPYREACDRLAAAASLPYSNSAWLLSWWEHMSPPGALLRTIVVKAGSEPVAIAPFFAIRDRPGFVEYRLIGAGTFHRIGPIAAPGTEALVAAPIARSLARIQPTPSAVRLEGLDAGSVWPQLIVANWGRVLKPWLHEDVRLPAPGIDLRVSSYEEWLRGRSRNFRSEIRRKRRRLQSAGGTVRLVGVDEDVGSAVGSLVRLHNSRWEHRSRSALFGPSETALLIEAGWELARSGAWRLWVIEAGSEIVAAELFVAVSGTVSYWGGGFSSEWSAYSPSNLLIAASIEDAISRGDSRMDLGGGEAHYKRRFADGDDPLLWTTIFPRGPGYPLARAYALKRHSVWRVRTFARAHLSDEAQDRLKAWRARLTPVRPRD